MTWDSTIKVSDILAIAINLLTIIAILSSPIIALRLQKLVEKNDDIKQRQLRIFRTLMATRSNKVSYEHVQALNAIDMEFYSEQEITKAWKDYWDHLNSKDKEGDKLQEWIDKGNDLFADLLNKMAEFLGYKFGINYLKRGFYFPEAHAHQEEFQNFMKDNISKILSGSQPIYIRATPASEEEALKNIELRNSMIEFFSSKKIIDSSKNE